MVTDAPKTYSEQARDVLFSLIPPAQEVAESTISSIPASVRAAFESKGYQCGYLESGQLEISAI
jgi:hypothetical protein